MFTNPLENYLETEATFLTASVSSAVAKTIVSTAVPRVTSYRLPAMASRW